MSLGQPPSSQRKAWGGRARGSLRRGVIHARPPSTPSCPALSRLPPHGPAQAPGPAWTPLQPTLVSRFSLPSFRDQGHQHKSNPASPLRSEPFSHLGESSRSGYTSVCAHPGPRTHPASSVPSPCCVHAESPPSACKTLALAVSEKPPSLSVPTPLPLLDVRSLPVLAPRPWARFQMPEIWGLPTQQTECLTDKHGLAGVPTFLPATSWACSPPRWLQGAPGCQAVFPAPHAHACSRQPDTNAPPGDGLSSSVYCSILSRLLLSPPGRSCRVGDP